MNILLVEDHPLYADALAGVIADAFAAQTVTSGSIAGAKAALLSDRRFDLVLLDLWLPDSTGFEGLIEIRMMRPSMPVVIVSSFTEPEVIHRAIACGAAGFIAKSSSKSALIHALSDALAGNVPLPVSYRPPESGDATEIEALRTRLGSLTQQQLRVLQMLCQGLLNKQIAHELCIGETTVKAHVSEILRKLGVFSRTQAVLGVSRVTRSMGWGDAGPQPLTAKSPEKS